MSTTTEKVKHTPGDVNHKFLAAAGYDFCTECGSSLRGKRTALEATMLLALEEIAGRDPMGVSCGDSPDDCKSGSEGTGCIGCTARKVIAKTQAKVSA